MGILDSLDPAAVLAKAIDEKARKVLDCENYVKPIVEEVDPPTKNLPIVSVKRPKYPTERWTTINTGPNRAQRRHKLGESE